MPRKPKFSKLPESSFTQEVEPISGTVRDNNKSPLGTRAPQSEESKAIKRINTNLKSLYDYIPGTENSYIAAYKRAFQDAGVETTTKMINGEEVLTVSNTISNRLKVDKLRRALVDENAKTLGDIRAEARRDIKQRGQKVTPEAIQDELITKRAYARLNDNAGIMYKEVNAGNPVMIRLYKAIKGLSRTENKDAFDYVVRQIDEEVQGIRDREREDARNKIKKSRRSRLPEDDVF